MIGKRTTRFAALLCLLVLATAVSGCTKCGWIWQDGGKVCRNDAPQ